MYCTVRSQRRLAAQRGVAEREPAHDGGRRDDRHVVGLLGGDLDAARRRHGAAGEHERDEGVSKERHKTKAARVSPDGPSLVDNVATT